MRPGQQERLIEKLSNIHRSNSHTFPGTIARYLLKGDADFTSLHVFFVWKDTEMPDEPLREQSFAAFQEELSDVLEWEHALSQTNEALLYT